MLNETKIKNAFGRVRKDLMRIEAESSNNARYTNVKVQEITFRLEELERRMAQIERLQIREHFEQ